MGKESGFDFFAPVRGVVKATKQEVSEQIAANALKATSKLLRISRNKNATNVAATLEKIAKRTQRE